VGRGGRPTHHLLVAATATRASPLAGWEREMVALAATGLSNEELATELVLSPLTVKTHINRAMAKLQVRDRAQLVVIAYQARLVEPGQPLPDRPFG
jgi:DNA-binding NarL/FixJ family response regulator